MSDTMPEDRPSIEQIQDDKKFDQWLGSYERKIAKLVSEQSAIKKKAKHG